MSIQYPNKTFVLDLIKTGFKGYLIKHFIVVTAKDKETAAQHLSDTLGFGGHPNELVWLMDTNHPTIYDQTGNKPLAIQAKILYNTSDRV